MIALGSYYHFSANDVASVEISNSKTNETHPYELKVCLKTGRDLTVCYNNLQTRDSARADLIRRIDSELRADNEKILCAMYNLRYTVERMDKRQLRIWRQLRDLLGVTIEED